MSKMDELDINRKRILKTSYTEIDILLSKQIVTFKEMKLLLKESEHEVVLNSVILMIQNINKAIEDIYKDYIGELE